MIATPNPYYIASLQFQAFLLGDIISITFGLSTFVVGIAGLVLTWVMRVGYRYQNNRKLFVIQLVAKPASSLHALGIYLPPC